MNSEPDYTDHDPLAPSAEVSAQAQADLLACIASTSPAHPDADYLRKFQPLDLRGVKDTER